MTWTVPEWGAFVLLALAAFRVFRLIGEDLILDTPREWVTSRLGEKSEPFILCPWCLGFWLSLAWWAAWVAWPHWTLVAATPWAISAVVGLVASRLDSD